MDRVESSHFTCLWLFLTCSNAWKIFHFRSPAFFEKEARILVLEARGMEIRSSRTEPTQFKVAGDKHEEKPCPGKRFLGGRQY